VSKLKIGCEIAADAAGFVVCDSLLYFLMHDGSCWQDPSGNRG
jgi:hypothetical protein